MWSFFSSSVPTSFPEHLQTDMHAHFLPGIDDGAPDMETALRLIRGLYSLGYSRLVATPHVMAGYYPNTAVSILSAFNQTQAAVQQAGIPISLYVGAEYFIDDSFLALIEQEELLCFGTKRCVLVEMSFVAPAPQWEEAIFALVTKGYQPILAHPERYTYWHRHPKAFQRFIERGAWLQVNISSLLGHYGKPIQQVAKTLWKEGHVSLLGTDIHHDQHLHLFQRFEKDKEIHKLLTRYPLNNVHLF
ncbi:MAG: tyrosine-protein phosphatase [Spirosomataceae bacterium]